MRKKVKVLSVTSGKLTPSSRFRIRQHIDKLNELDICVEDACPFIDKNKSVPGLSMYSPKYYLPIYLIWQLLKILQRIPVFLKQFHYDFIWLNRELLTGYLTLEPLFRKKIILDVDDAIWKNPPFGQFAAKYLAKKAHKIICGNEYLADWFQKYNDKVYIVPTAVDTEKFRPVVHDKNTITIGWIGTHGNLKYLERIYSSLLEILGLYPHVHLSIVSDQKPNFITTNKSIEFTEWSAANEVNDFQNIDIGLMPLDDDEWTRGKCSYKMLQHMSCGALVVGSPVGMNKNILQGEINGAYPVRDNDDWIRVLTTLIDNFPELYSAQSTLARNFIVEKYSADVVRLKLAKVFADE